MHRFFLPSHAFEHEIVLFPDETARQIRRVLRLRTGDFVTCLDNKGSEYLVELSGVNAQVMTGLIREKWDITGEPSVQLHMLLCLSQREKFEWMLQKCTEVGTTEFTPVLSSRSLVQDARSLENKYPRWKRIIQEAAEQSGRGKIPQLNETCKFEAGLTQSANLSSIRLLAWEGEKSSRLTDALNGKTPEPVVSILIGPEGGLSDEEAVLAVNLGWKPVSLGRRILRMETAAVVAAALTIDWFDAQSD